MSVRDWSNDSQTHSQICILESRIEEKNQEIASLRDEIERLQQLVKTLTKVDINTDIMDRFK